MKERTMDSKHPLPLPAVLVPRVGGVTMIELLIVILVLGILTAIAVPSYQEHVARSNRAEAKGILLETAQFMERNYTVANRYDLDGAGNATVLPFATSPKPGGGAAKYNITAAYGAAPAQTFTLTATRTGSMATDACGDLTVDQTGTRGLANNSLTVAECWGR
jgi:type IV pilus assembly protein PilE